MRSFLLCAAFVALLPAFIIATPSGKTPYFYRRAYQEASEVHSDIPIHSSCNASQTMQIKRGLFDSKRLAREAADHILLKGNTSTLFQTYFGSQADPAVPLGIYERILEGDKTGTLIRCDDPDQNCATQEGWNGHWRGNNATEETVICELSFHSRLGLEKACGNGFKLGRDNVNVYWGADLLHRMMHLPKVTNGYITHVADTHEDMMKIAIEKPDQSVKNQHSIQEFAFEAWIRKYTNPEGCSASEEEIHAAEHDDHNHSSSTTATATGSASVASAAAATTSDAAKDCHSHADGTVHCV
ncbi:hypothetical protein L7F22_043722 [Adiantum nelumboides]|nr:hypothetical protein [Adiantum nelumboides]